MLQTRKTRMEPVPEAALTTATEFNGAAPTARVDAEAVRAHLERILATPDFASAPQLSAFLRYVVERKLAGDEHSLKAYTIATEALGRPMSFDPQNDPTVRVQARRLRQALLLYYAGAGADEPLRIDVPLGGYVPEFIGAAAAPAAPAAAAAAPADRRLLPTPWVGPVALILSIISIVVNLVAIFPDVVIYILSKLR
jgi:hypothetical protein